MINLSERSFRKLVIALAIYLASLFAESPPLTGVFCFIND